MRQLPTAQKELQNELLGCMISICRESIIKETENAYYVIILCDEKN
jgi:hypothetical protein